MFTPTKWDSAGDKATFANALARFIASDFRLSLFTEKLYSRLHNCFGHIAYTDRGGFISEFFETNAGKIDFLDQTMRHPCYGDPAFTYSDVERGMIARLRACGILPFYRALHAAETEARERQQLAALLAKYDGQPAGPPPTTAPPPYPSAPPARRPPSQNGRQPSLL
jgi:hypothetical protein